MNQTTSQISIASRNFARLVRTRATALGINDSPWPRLKLNRAEAPLLPTSVLYQACLCVVAQGGKRAIVGEETYEYDPMQYLVVPVPLPILAEIPTASPETPYLGISLQIDSSTVNELLLELEEVAPSPKPVSRAVYVSEVEPALLSALVRLLEALDDPREKRLLAPAAEREILYRVLTGPQGERLRQLVRQDSAGHRIAQTVRYLQEHFEQPIDVPTLAAKVNMSPSAFQHTFKRVTSLSPIQYLKRLRLHQARALMLRNGLGASDAAFRVGYGSPSQFSREFRRQFGAPPIQEIERLRTP
ncbi:MAG: AraC family transcriptional regulator [Deltaproteobacteria bacterium]|nr:AraC family transcriptional regulator [Deltaproteobacteria bacterium]